MSFYNIDEMEPEILYGLINEKLRLECNTLDDLINKYEVDKSILQDKLDYLNCYYDISTNQLKLK